MYQEIETKRLKEQTLIFIKMGYKLCELIVIKHGLKRGVYPREFTKNGLES